MHYFLIRKKYDKFPEVLYSCRDSRDRYKMILKYCDEHKIKSVCDSPTEFKPHEAREGLHLIKINNDEYVSKEVVNTGIVFDYWAMSKIDRINIVGFEVVDDVNDLDDMSVAMKELKMKIKKKI